MASTPPISVQPSDLVRHTEPLRSPDSEAVVSARALPEEPVGLTPLMARPPVELDVVVPVTATQTNLMEADLPQISTQLSLTESQRTSLGDVISQPGAGSLFNKLS